jgi:hypothetical protein
MSFIRTYKRALSDGTARTYYARVENVWEGGKVRQRVIEHLGTNPHARTFPLDPRLAANVALALIEGRPSTALAAERLRGLGLDIPPQAKQFSLTYTPPLKRYTLRCE